jgi:hypothetical protein
VIDALAALRPQLPALAVELRIDALDAVPEAGGFRVEARHGAIGAALKVRPDDGQPAYDRTPRWVLAVDGSAGPLDPQLEAAFRALVPRIGDLDRAGHPLPRAGQAAAVLDAGALLSLPLAAQLARLRRDDIDAVVLDTDACGPDPLAGLPAGTRAPRVVHLVGTAPVRWVGLPGLAARGVLSVHLPVADPSGLPEPEVLRAWRVRRLLVPWPGTDPAVGASLRDAGFEIVAVASSPDALLRLDELGAFAATLVAPEGVGDRRVAVVKAGFPARIPPTAFVPEALLPPVGLPPRR